MSVVYLVYLWVILGQFGVPSLHVTSYIYYYTF